ncbi:MAG: peptidylprolyl isomerase [Thermoleophilia bacterium]
MTLLLLAGSLLLSGCGDLPDDAAARVNGTIIAKSDVNTRIDYLNDMYPGMVSREDETNFPKIRRQATKDLVWAELERQEAERRGISVSDADIDYELQRLADEEYLGDLVRLLESYAELNVTREELSQITRERLLHEKLVADVQRDVSVSDYDIQAYYERNLKQYNQPERRQTRYIVSTSRDDALAAADRVRSGESFVEVARQVSVDPMATENGGSLGLVAPGQVAPELEAVIFTMNAGQISDPVNVADKWYVTTVEAVMPGTEPMTDEEVRAEIEGIIAAELSAAQWKTVIDGLYNEATLEFDPDYEPAVTKL